MRKAQIMTAQQVLALPFATKENSCNVRGVKQTTPAFKAMMKQIKQDPVRFFDYHSGITLAKINKSYFVLNGGHTLQVFKSCLAKDINLDSVEVPVLIKEVDSKIDAVLMATALNRSTPVDIIDIEVALGTFDDLMSHFNDNNIEWQSSTLKGGIKFKRLFSLIASTDYRDNIKTLLPKYKKAEDKSWYIEKIQYCLDNELYNKTRVIAYLLLNYRNVTEEVINSIVEKEYFGDKRTAIQDPRFEERIKQLN